MLDSAAVEGFFAKEKPEYVFVAAARVGGILANNSFPADFLWENLQIQNHLIHGAWRSGVRKLLFLGSSCIYPKLAAWFVGQVMKETGGKANPAQVNAALKVRLNLPD